MAGMIVILFLSFLLCFALAGPSWFVSWWITLFYCMNVFWMDFKSYYIPKSWMAAGCFLCFLWLPFHMEASLLLGLPCLILWWKRPDWIGYADVFYIFLFGGILGMERMIVCMFAAVFLGFLYGGLFRGRLIPFVSCLCAGFVLSFWRGFLIYDILCVWK